MARWRVEAAERTAWRHTASVMAMIHNASPNCKKALTHEDFYPKFRPLPGEGKPDEPDGPVEVPFRAMKSLFKARGKSDAAREARRLERRKKGAG